MGAKSCASLSSSLALPHWSLGLPNLYLCVLQPPNSKHVLLHLFPTILGRGSPLTTTPYRRRAPWGADLLTPEWAQVKEERHSSEPHETMNVKVLCKQQVLYGLICAFAYRAGSAPQNHLAMWLWQVTSPV